MSGATPVSRWTLRAVAACGALLAATTAAAAAPHGKHHLPAPLPSPREGAAIEGFAPDQSQFFCRSKVQPGVKAFERRVLAHYPVSHSDGDTRGCDVGGASEHKDGRAWDWGVDHRIAAQRAAGKSMLQWLFKTDAHGNKDAMFRRLGLMYVIWNKRIWGAWSQHWEPYSCSGPTLCHVNHMHFSFSWAGAEKKTSYWTHQVSPVVEPPLPVLGKVHAHRLLRVSPRQGSVNAMWLLHRHATYHVTATGTWRAGHRRADAMCTQTASGWRRTSAGGLRVDGDQIDSWGEQWRPVHDNGSGCDARAHTYRLVLDQSAPSTVNVQLPGGSAHAAGAVNVRFVRIN
jgi:hypothetical protein